MQILRSLTTLLAATLVVSCATPDRVAPSEEGAESMKRADVTRTVQPPDIAELPREVQHLDETWIDPYGGMRDRDDPRVIGYLEAENAYAETMMRSTSALQDELFEETLGRIKEDDTTAPYRDGGFLYYSRTFEGKDYPVYYRRPSQPDDAPEEVLLDPNELAKKHDYVAVGVLQPSPDHRRLAYSIDTLGDERFVLYVKDLETGRLVGEPVRDTYYSLEWAADSSSFFYTRIDDLNRPHEVLHHVVGTPADSDRLVYREADEKFYLGLSRSLSRRWIFVEGNSAVTSEVRLIDAQDPTADPKLFAERRDGVEYLVTHRADDFYVMTNDRGARTFRIAKTTVGANGYDEWKDHVAPRDEVTISDLRAFDDHLVWIERRDGLERLMIETIATGERREVEFPEAPYTLRFGVNVEASRDVVRVDYSSMTRPPVVFDVPLDGGELVVVKRTEVPGYDPGDYETARIWAVAPDGTRAEGTRVPISLMWRPDRRPQGPAKLLLYGYGAYGSSYDPHFSASRTVLADRGLVVGIAHVRGGGDLGRLWYEDGKLLDKPNTFTDFIACAQHLVDEGWTAPDRLAISGRSAGGLLMGAVVNMRPDLFQTVVAGVPFVDMLNTMLDASLPLTQIEYQEWGDPNEPHYFRAMKSYSPYDNVSEADFPNILATAGLNDPRVGFWEPAKWIAKIRDHQRGDSLILLKTQMGAGHGGPSGRYADLREIAFQYAFILKTLGVTPK